MEARQQQQQHHQQQPPNQTPINNSNHAPMTPASTTTVPHPSQNHRPYTSHPAGIPREREPPNHAHIQQQQQQQQQQTTDTQNAGAGGPAFVPFGKRPLEFVTCYKVSLSIIFVKKNYIQRRRTSQKAHGVLFQRCFNVGGIQTTLYRRQNNVVCSLGYCDWKST